MIIFLLQNHRLSSTPTEHQNHLYLSKSKKSSLVEIPSYVFKIVTDIISSLFARLINDSSSKRKLLSCSKTTKVLPNLKSGSELEMENYRPVSTRPFSDSFFRRLIYSKLYNFLVAIIYLLKINMAFVKKKID